MLLLEQQDLMHNQDLGYTPDCSRSMRADRLHSPIIRDTSSERVAISALLPLPIADEELVFAVSKLLSICTISDSSLLQRHTLERWTSKRVAELMSLYHTMFCHVISSSIFLSFGEDRFAVTLRFRRQSETQFPDGSLKPVCHLLAFTSFHVFSCLVTSRDQLTILCHLTLAWHEATAYGFADKIRIVNELRRLAMMANVVAYLPPLTLGKVVPQGPSPAPPTSPDVHCRVSYFSVHAPPPTSYHQCLEHTRQSQTDSALLSAWRYVSMSLQYLAAPRVAMWFGVRTVSLIISSALSWTLSTRGRHCWRRLCLFITAIEKNTGSKLLDMFSSASELMSVYGGHGGLRK
ncbi:hypothetical protein BDY19DRAFT_907202 [Irpex rosettiformis]|uniref:Uncharacterized protein n=1 Tax=Irpex rosettiformis TaxID=378272 RepID=A0ACB8U0J4_9APHY|nr:hypothetical protein BDY19DRAFT_907202 [Irpex rosettiformis]